MALPLRALILETYGTGNAPIETPVLSALEQAAHRGLLIMNLTQCLEACRYGAVCNWTSVATRGVISADDMTPEALYCKLLVACSQTNDIEALRVFMQTPLCGEKRNA